VVLEEVGDDEKCERVEKPAGDESHERRSLPSILPFSPVTVQPIFLKKCYVEWFSGR
jgi:hypothetical protein